MNFFVLLLAAFVITSICLLAMAVGVLFRGRSFTSCGCASLTFNGERIDCPGCVNPPAGDAPRCARTGEICDGDGECHQPNRAPGHR